MLFVALVDRTGIAMGSGCGLVHGGGGGGEG